MKIQSIQARTQGFEKGGYIVKKFPFNFWHFNVELFFSHDRCKNKQFHREHGAHYYETIPQCNMFIVHTKSITQKVGLQPPFYGDVSVKIV